MSSSDDKIAEQIFAGSLSILAVLIAVVGLVGAAQDKVSAISYLAWKFETLQWFMAGLSAFAGIVAWLALSKMRGSQTSIGLIIWVSRVLIVGTVLATVGFVLVS